MILDGTAPGMKVRGGEVAFDGNIVFRNIDVRLPPSKTVALPSKSGCSRISLLYLLAGLPPNVSKRQHCLERVHKGDHRLARPQGWLFARRL